MSIKEYDQKMKELKEEKEALKRLLKKNEEQIDILIMANIPF